MPALETVAEYIAEARRLLQDEQASMYRYPDADLASALSIGLMEARRLRADLFYPFKTAIPSYTLPGDAGAKVPVDPMYRSALVYYMVGRAELRDGEIDSEQRAGALLGLFKAQLTAM